MIKIKNIGKIIAANVVCLLFIFGTSGVSACSLDSELIAGKDITVGNVAVRFFDDTHYLWIIFTTADGWEITDTHVAVATSLGGIPTNNKGAPKIGHFPYTDPYVNEPTMVRYLIDLSDFPSIYHDGVVYGGTLYIATHAVVQHPCYGEETAWGDTFGQPFPGAAGWAMYFTFTVPDLS